MLADARVRLALRAVLAGLVAGAVVLQSSDDPFSSATVYAAATAVFWGVVEYLTPLNKLVGVGK